ncbi:spore maturation protein CgeB [Arthrobacter stackebrandtii]|uniref:Spore maturation protein CgeB n=1 Tax=Arthrobacter stackebrandtii TaxID=272161 RepID=A0ABS4YZ93_9MICC|nr:glycosyltransferase [Arthrobacter stackebrandtii]MBP2414044.1 spore maturation protein CgeB [Arthrobacter stackebrandtii]PYG99044.1 glycosyltransferase [Arthrobacter stackebrandtii]
MYTVNEAKTALWHLRSGGPEQLKEWQARRRVDLGFAAPTSVQGVEGGWVGRGKKRHLSFTPADIPTGEARRNDLKVGVILDDFSAMAFRFEWNAVALDPAAWAQQLDGLDLVFIESAWAGNERLWRGKIASDDGPAQPFIDMLAACKAQGIPTVFWNKEDPPHYDDFLPAAKLFDVVFTSDEGRIESYRRDLGHDRIDVLPFAAQPAVHNPVRPAKGWHKRDVAFGGMYFAHKYPERREQMDLLLNGVMDASSKMDTGLEIFSRQLGGSPEYQFPAPLDSRVVGSLTYPQMLSAYKAYKVFLNVNSVVDSASMCARRIFEISAAGTPVITTPSAAIRNFFTEDEVPVAETRESAAHQSRALVKNAELNDRTAHLAQRRIWQEHTYAHRVESVLASALPGRASGMARPTASALVPTIRPQQIENVFRTAASQNGIETQLVLLTHGFELEQDRLRKLQEQYNVPNVALLTAGRDVSLGECLNRCVAAADGDVLAKMDDDDHYGVDYLSDQIFALDYSRAQIVGKQAHYMHLESSKATILRFGHKEHRYTDFVMGPTIVAAKETFIANPFPALGLGEDTGFLRNAGQSGMQIYSADRFNFYQVRAGDGHTWQVEDAELLASGDLKFYGDPSEHTDI